MVINCEAVREDLFAFLVYIVRMKLLNFSVLGCDMGTPLYILKRVNSKLYRLN